MEQFVLPMTTLALMGCPTKISAQENAAGGAPLILEEFFDGDLDAHGVILTRGGKVRRSFNAVMRGAWEEKNKALHGILTEDFQFNDGEKLLRRWEFLKVVDGEYTGTADDVEGTAALETAGNALRMDYSLIVPVSGKSIVVNVEDWLWLMTPNIVVNKSIMCKWGFRVGEIITTIVRNDEGP